MSNATCLRRIGIAPLAALLLGLVPAQAQTAPAPPPPAQPAPAQPAPAPAVARGAAAWQLLVGNTVIAKSREGGYTEFYATDGAVQHLDKDGTTTGKWSVQGDKVCFDFPEEDDRSCVEVEVDGGKGVFIDEDKARDTFEIAPGNARNL